MSLVLNGLLVTKFVNGIEQTVALAYSSKSDFQLNRITLQKIEAMQIVGARIQFLRVRVENMSTNSILDRTGPTRYRSKIEQSVNGCPKIERMEILCIGIRFVDRLALSQPNRSIRYEFTTMTKKCIQKFNIRRSDLEIQFTCHYTLFLNCTVVKRGLGCWSKMSSLRMFCVAFSNAEIFEWTWDLTLMRKLWHVMWCDVTYFLFLLCSAASYSKLNPWTFDLDHLLISFPSVELIVESPFQRRSTFSEKVLNARNSPAYRTSLHHRHVIAFVSNSNSLPWSFVSSKYLMNILWYCRFVWPATVWTDQNHGNILWCFRYLMLGFEILSFVRISERLLSCFTKSCQEMQKLFQEYLRRKQK
jgi:hypothetical protein